MNNFRTNVLTWHDYTEYRLSCSMGTVSVYLYNEPIDKELDVRAVIGDLYVDKAYRRTGVATSLLQQAEEIAKEKGYDEVFMHWRHKDSERWVLQWYLRKGYDDVAFDGRGEYCLLKKML